MARVVLISLIVFISSCSGLYKSDSKILRGTRTIQDVYNEHYNFQTSILQTLNGLPDGATHLAGYTRDVYDELSVRFRRLPNPTIIMYIFPHLSVENTPIPGYSTMFQMYEKVEYALPGELAE